MQRFGALGRWLRAHFARDEHELPLLKAIKDAILAENRRNPANVGLRCRFSKPSGIYRMPCYEP